MLLKTRVANSGIRALCLVFAVCIAAPGSANANTGTSGYVEALIKTSRALGLAGDRYWLSLLHYKPARGGGYKSQADDAEFFSHPRGRTEPRLELEATLRAFFEPDSGDRHARCRFPARYHWLSRRLQFEPRRLPAVACTEYHEWRTTLNAHSATLVFPAAYLNGPSSMFGHTLLRINPGDSRRDVPLAAYALNYAANANPADNGAFYAYKGIFGGYPGVFSIVPYYRKLTEYGELENRDVWEYDLNLDQGEVDQLLRHAWEVRTVNFDYYFLTENCSYHMLSLLEVARPGIDLTDGFSLKAIPADTVRAVVAAGMVEHINYRPSMTTVIKQRLKLLDRTRQDNVRALASAEQDVQAWSDSDETLQTRSRVLELAFDYSRYRALRNASVRDKHTDQSYALLKARSELPAGNVWPDTVWSASRPEQGHRTSRLATGAGRLDGRDFMSLRFRPAYHDILDPLPGYTRGAQINFLDFRGRYFPDDNSLKLDKFTLIDILSLTPRDRFFKPVSWSVDTGLERMLTNDGPTNGAQLNGGGGVSYTVAGGHLAYALLQAQIKVARRFEKSYSLGGGAASGLLLFFDRSTANLEFRGLGYALGETDNYFQARWRQSFPLGSRLALRYILDHSLERGHTHNTAELLLDWYF
jgi:hypothetical protein